MIEQIESKRQVIDALLAPENISKEFDDVINYLEDQEQAMAKEKMYKMKELVKSDSFFNQVEPQSAETDLVEPQSPASPFDFKSVQGLQTAQVTRVTCVEGEGEQETEPEEVGSAKINFKKINKEKLFQTENIPSEQKALQDLIENQKQAMSLMLESQELSRAINKHESSDSNGFVVLQQKSSVSEM